jgi:hypothetical protein
MEIKPATTQRVRKAAVVGMSGAMVMGVRKIPIPNMEPVTIENAPRPRMLRLG